MPRKEFDSEAATEDVPDIPWPGIERIREQIRKDLEELRKGLKKREIGIDTTPPLES